MPRPDSAANRAEARELRTAPGPPTPPCVVVMGVSGTGKTTVARLLADRLDVPVADADDFHPAANIAKMSAGTPLDDTDREPWLALVGRWLHEREAAGSGGVIACSALKRWYRDILRAAAPSTFFLLLTAERTELIRRVGQRRGHYMPASLIDSQLGTLEPLRPDERGAALATDRPPNAVADAAVVLLQGPAEETRS